MFIGLNSLFMANEQCITRWFKKKKAPNANVDVNPNWPWDYKNVTLHIDITSSEPNAPLVCLLVHYHCILSYVFHLRSVWFWRWKSERKKKREGMEKWESRRNFTFPPFVFGWEWKSEWMEKKLVCINLLICPC